MKNILIILLSAIIVTSCGSGGTRQKAAISTSDTMKHIKLITVDPGHFHAALVQKIMYPDRKSVV